MSLSVRIEGLDKYLTVLDPVRFTREIDKAVFKAAQVLRDETKRMPPVSAARTGYGAKGIPVAPKYGGTLRQSISARKTALMAADVYVGDAAADYGGFVHDGTSRMPARPWFQWLLDDFQGTKLIEITVTSALERVASPS